MNCETTADNCIILEIEGETYEKCSGHHRNADVDANCECEDGYYDNDGNLEDCVECDSNCYTCTSSS